MCQFQLLVSVGSLRCKNVTGLNKEGHAEKQLVVGGALVDSVSVLFVFERCVFVCMSLSLNTFSYSLFVFRLNFSSWDFGHTNVENE